MRVVRQTSSRGLLLAPAKSSAQKQDRTLTGSRPGITYAERRNSRIDPHLFLDSHMWLKDKDSQRNRARASVKGTTVATLGQWDRAIRKGPTRVTWGRLSLGGYRRVANGRQGRPATCP